MLSCVQKGLYVRFSYVFLGSKMNLDKTIRLSRLFDVYKGLLTEKQVKVLNSYLNYNGSLAEIAEDLDISRQAVLDLVTRTTKRLELFEKKLMFCKKFDLINKRVEKLSLNKETTEKFAEDLKQIEQMGD